jgi:pyruvate dehydrogenase E2 component (dihydrolipoyllysine-residue acetyltransferase)
MTESQALSVKGETVTEEPSAAQRTVARRTAEARATIPHVEMMVEVEMEAALARLQRDGGSLDALLVQACARALRAVPRANAAYRDGRFEQYSRINVGLVVADGEVYVIPTVFDADRRSLAELSTEIEELTSLARERRLSPPAFSGATFTLWNAGAHDLSSSTIVINPPQAAGLAAGAVREVAVIRDGRAVSGRRMTVTLACDHRILYGAEAARFLRELRSQLQAGDP